MNEGEAAHAHTNRLIESTSPYLLQHAHNPVDWYPWGEEALARSRAEDKPILLSIGYSACHWCHVMERESFENEEIARAHERALRPHQGGPRGAARPGRHLHGGHAGHERGAGRLADDGVPHARPGAVLRRHLFPARRSLRPARASRPSSTASPTSGQRDREGLRAQAAEVTRFLRENTRAAPGLSVGVDEMRKARGAAHARLRRALGRLRAARRSSRPPPPSRCSCAPIAASATRRRCAWRRARSR